MQNRWNDSHAKTAIEKYNNFSEDIALRVYTSRLIGIDSALVLHGGGNTSVKSLAKNAVGEEVNVLYVKGSGWDLDTLEPPGLPGVQLEHLIKLRQLSCLSDEDMVNEQRTHLLNAMSPNPSVETLLHAFLPHKFKTNPKKHFVPNHFVLYGLLDSSSSKEEFTHKKATKYYYP